MKQKSKFFLFLAIAGILLIITGKILGEQSKKTTQEESFSFNNKLEVDLKIAVRRLWDDHVVWTRNVVFCIIDDLPGTDLAVARLLKNQDDIGDAIKPYYGEDNGKKLTDLLHTHITIAADLLKATKIEDKDAFDETNKKWYDNADEIALFLSKANPNWKLADMKNMMHEHLKLTTDEAVARKKKIYDEDVKAFDKVDEEILKMADILSDGIIKQFPEKFKTGIAIGINK